MKHTILLSFDLLKRLDCIAQFFTGEIYRISKGVLVKQKILLIDGEILFLDMIEKRAFTVNFYKQINRLYSPVKELVAERAETSDLLTLTEAGLQQLIPKEKKEDDFILFGLALTNPKQYKFIKEIRGYLGYYKKIDLSWYFDS